MANTQTYDLLAALLEYPTEQMRSAVDACCADLQQSFPQAVGPVTEFARYATETPLETAQERYTQTFDLNPVCSLDVGYHLFGEDYQRGGLLAKLQECEQEAGVDSGGELPDHLPVLLRWLGRVQEPEVFHDMIALCVQPALEKMLQSLAESGSPYRTVLSAVQQLLSHDLEALPVASEEAEKARV